RLARSPVGDWRAAVPLMDRFVSRCTARMPISLIQCLRDTPLAFVDVETTGASADFGHRVIEIGICRVEGGRVVAEYEQLIDPGRRISAGVTALTGISQAMVAGK